MARPRLACLPIAIATFVLATYSSAHPGSGIGVDRQGQVYFIDTGSGLWKLDAKGALIASVWDPEPNEPGEACDISKRRGAGSLRKYTSDSMLLCMRTTVDINDELMRRAKKKAANDGVPLRDVVEDALRRYLFEKPTASGYKLKWTTEKGELMPGVDLDDRDSLFDLMDGIKK